MAYTVRVSREGRWWALAIPELGADALTQARRLSDMEREARDYIAVTMDVAPSNVEVHVVLDDVGLTAEALARSEDPFRSRLRRPGWLLFVGNNMICH